MFTHEDIYSENINEKLLHLNQDEILNLINRYYADEKVSTLLHEYQISLKSNNLYKYFPPLYSDDICPYCNEEMLYTLKSKASESFNYERTFCEICNHIKSENCNCRGCMELIKSREYKKAKTIRENIERNRQVVDFNNLSEENTLYLSVLLRTGLDEDTNYILPPKNYIDMLAPTEELALELINSLTNSNIIELTVDFGTQFFYEEDEKWKYDVLKNHYKINRNYLYMIDESEVRKDECLKLLIYPLKSKISNETCHRIWKKISYHESIRYLLHHMEKVGYDFNPGKKTKLVFEKLVENFSTAQIYNIIYSSLKNSTVQYQSKKITKKHAQNLVITSCELRGERAIASSWDIMGYRRDWDLQSTMLGNILFNSIMNIGELGFTEVPTFDY